MSRVIQACLTILLVVSCAFSAYAGSSNLLRNGSFEEVSSRGFYNEAQYWQFGNPDRNGDSWGSASRENWRAHSGEFLAAIRGLWAGRGTHGGFWQDTKAEPGNKYRFTGWFYCDPEWVAQSQEIKIEFWDEKKKETLKSNATPIQDCDMKWGQVSIEAIAPEGASWVRVVVSVSYTGASGSLQLDDLELISLASTN